MKTSIKIKKFWYSDIATDGGVGNKWKEVQIGQREATVQFQGSDAAVTNYKNVVGSTLESLAIKGDKTVGFQLADLTPDVVAAFTGGTVTSDVTSDRYDAPENENEAIEKSIRFLTDKNILFEMARVSFDGYPLVNDDDLHYYQIKGTVLLPEKTGVTSYAYDVLKIIDATDILTFTLDEQDSPATINDTAHTVAIDVAIGTDPSALSPVVGVDLGASVEPNSADEVDFTSPVTYTVMAADGTTQDWVVTVTVLV